MVERPFQIELTSPEDAYEVAAENFLADVQFALQASLKLAGITRRELARRLGKSEATISRQLDESGNLTLRTVGRILAAIGDEAVFSTRRFDEAKCENRGSNTKGAVKTRGRKNGTDRSPDVPTLPTRRRKAKAA